MERGHLPWSSAGKRICNHHYGNTHQVIRMNGRLMLVSECQRCPFVRKRAIEKKETRNGWYVLAPAGLVRLNF